MPKARLEITINAHMPNTVGMSADDTSDAMDAVVDRLALIAKNLGNEVDKLPNITVQHTGVELAPE